MSANPDSVVNQGAFHSSIRPSHPLSQRHPVRSLCISVVLLNKSPSNLSLQHALGKKIGNDAAPDFHCHTVPSGSAPPDRTFRPDTSKSIPGQSYPNSKRETWQSAESTLTGSTSGDVHGWMGEPFHGHKSEDLRHQTTQKSGPEGVRATAQDLIKKRGPDSQQVDHKGLY